VGDWLNTGELRWKDTYEEAAQATGLAHQTLMNAKMVSKAFKVSRRREKLTWSHHADVASLHESEQDEWLDKAEESMSKLDFDFPPRDPCVGTGSQLKCV
jgi:hypothetical protein